MTFNIGILEICWGWSIFDKIGLWSVLFGSVGLDHWRLFWKSCHPSALRNAISSYGWLAVIGVGRLAVFLEGVCHIQIVVLSSSRKTK